jgi:hypothetical protein
MRKITNKSVNAFYESKPFKEANMEIEVLPNVTIMKLHGNSIAFKYNDPENTLAITNYGWFSNTTKERLNGLPGVSIVQKKGVWYLNGKEWDGKMTNV